MGLGPSKSELEKIKIETAAKNKPVEIEWAARKEIELAKVALGGKTVELENTYKMEKLTNDKIKNTLHVQTQSEIIAKILERGLSPDDYCLAAGISFLTLKDELGKDEMETLKKTMMSAMDRKTKVHSKRRNRHASESDTGCESDQDTAQTHVGVSTMT